MTVGVSVDRYRLQGSNLPEFLASAHQRRLGDDDPTHRVDETTLYQRIVANQSTHALTGAVWAGNASRVDIRRDGEINIETD